MNIKEKTVAELKDLILKKLEKQQHARIKKQNQIETFHPNSTSGEWVDPHRVMDHARDLTDLAYMLEWESSYTKILNRLDSHLKQFDDAFENDEIENPTLASVMASFTECCDTNSHNPNPEQGREMKYLMFDVYLVLDRAESNGKFHHR